LFCFFVESNFVSHKNKKNMKHLLITLIFIQLLMACGEKEIAPANNTNGKNLRDANLPDDFPLTGCFATNMDFDLNSSIPGASGNFKYTITYDNLNRVTKVVNNSNVLPNTTTYTYEKGKITGVNETKYNGNTIKTIIIYTLDSKNKVTEQESSVESFGSVAITKTTFKYDTDGYLIESKNLSSPTQPVTVYTWEGGNLSKTTITDSKPTATEKNKTIITYEYDKSKTLGTWDPSFAGNPGSSLSPSYSGKPTKNIVTKITQVTETSSTNSFFPFDYKLTVVTDNKYTFDAKGIPSDFGTESKVTSSGSLPLGLNLNYLNVTSKGKMQYTCK
jgi:hypothetical protein